MCSAEVAYVRPRGFLGTAQGRGLRLVPGDHGKGSGAMFLGTPSGWPSPSARPGSAKASPSLPAAATARGAGVKAPVVAYQRLHPRHGGGGAWQPGVRRKALEDELRQVRVRRLPRYGASTNAPLTTTRWPEVSVAVKLDLVAAPVSGSPSAAAAPRSMLWLKSAAILAMASIPSGGFPVTPGSPSVPYRRTRSASGAEDAAEVVHGQCLQLAPGSAAAPELRQQVGTGSAMRKVSRRRTGRGRSCTGPRARRDAGTLDQCREVALHPRG